MKKADKKLSVVTIVEKKYFKHRVCSDNERLGEFMYDFFIELLESVGEEIVFEDRRYDRVMFFSQVESSHNQRNFIVNKKTGDAIRKFRCNIHDELEEFAKDNRAKGKNILMQLNSGELSLNDFDESLKSRKR